MSRDKASRPSQQEVLQAIDEIKARYGLAEPLPSDEELLAEQMEDQARYIAKALGEEFSEIHVDLVPRLLSPEKLEEVIAEVKAYGRFLLEEISAETDDELA